MPPLHSDFLCCLLSSQRSDPMRYLSVRHRQMNRPRTHNLNKLNRSKKNATGIQAWHVVHYCIESIDDGRFPLSACLSEATRTCLPEGRIVMSVAIDSIAVDLSLKQCAYAASLTHITWIPVACKVCRT